jgi:hypothetical protein
VFSSQRLRKIPPYRTDSERRGDAGPVRLLLGGETHWRILVKPKLALLLRRLTSRHSALLSVHSYTLTCCLRRQP